ncbi:sulfite reductase (NADPH) beta subunit [Jezberella montanilacus]|jgi:sulfite reductase (NADPH) hemoprotein beta-component|uniref:Sulfite reductase (NADPH) beta subunit n=1 Tax=Jezberella montanilacus TaxID=323426 RepID=A0A2T0XDU8_9BURK|nr:nitrite/sulfite reductase [Jezberella montanilacus]PRY97105.1 sulfite reductase (NADPH) beta subunit [Jezberella montanilacus]
MYQPNVFDTDRLKERAAQLAGQIHRNKIGQLSDDHLKPLRLQNGLYIQRYAPMLRIAIAYGMLNSAQLRTLAQVARQYDRGYGHLTTRQNMQLNWISLDDTPKALADLAEVGIHGIQSSGNCLRNITSDALAGIAPDEILDPRPYAELMRQWSTFHPELCFLPRKFKVALTGTPEDRALVQLHDMAFEVVRAEPEAVFRVRVGGGMGRTPILAPVLREELEWKHLLTYTHAVMRVYNELGRRDNLTKARIKILVRAVGIDTFRELVEAEWARLRDGIHQLTQSELDRVKATFVEPDWTKGAALLDVAGQFNGPDKSSWDHWLKRNRLPHRRAGYAAILIPLKHHTRAPGDVTSDEMDAIAGLADRFSQGFIRVSHTQDFVLPAVLEKDLPELYVALKKLNLHHALGGLLGSMVSCPGGDFCALANARSIPVAEDIARRYQSIDAQENIGPLDLRISGCMNSCGHHHTGHIGILGVDKDGAAFYQVLLGGHSGHGSPAALGSIIGKAFAEDEIGDAIEEILDTYLELREPGENFKSCVARLGKQPFANAADLIRKKVKQSSEATSETSELAS